jgi:hypothetical protein
MGQLIVGYNRHRARRRPGPFLTYDLSQSVPAGAYSLTFNAQLADGVANVTYAASFTSSAVGRAAAPNR